MPAITRCYAADRAGVSHTYVDCPLIQPVSARPGCQRCPPWVAAVTQRDQEMRETGVVRQIRDVAAEWQPCPFIHAWQFQRLASTL
jgi:hypothetical protein